MSRRRHQGPAADFFAFQDIITATTGILIVITLLLALSIGTTRIKGILEERKANASSTEAVARTTSQIQALAQERDARLALQVQIKTRQAELLAYLQTEVDSLATTATAGTTQQSYRRLIPPTQAGLSHPLLVVAQGQRLQIVDPAGQIVRTLEGARGSNDVQAELRQALTKPFTGILFLIKPSVFQNYAAIVTIGMKTQAPFGFDIIPEDWEVGLQ
jgi:hypothetical protein